MWLARPATYLATVVEQLALILARFDLCRDRSCHFLVPRELSGMASYCHLLAPNDGIAVTLRIVHRGDSSPTSSGGAYDDQTITIPQSFQPSGEPGFRISLACNSDLYSVDNQDYEQIVFPCCQILLSNTRLLPE